MSAPLVSVYIPNHNYEKYLAQSIDSALNQTLGDFELIIIDDGSTDGSRTIIERYRKHPKVKIVFQENRGLNVSNNVAIRISSGKYIMRLDADDFLHPDALKVMAGALEKTGGALVFPDYFLVDPQGQILSEFKRHNFDEVTLLDQPAHGACTLFRKTCLLEVGCYSTEFQCEDNFEIWLKLIKHYKVINVNQSLFYYRQHAQSMTRNENVHLARHEILKNEVSKLNVAHKNHLCIIPVRGGEDEPLALKRLGDKTLIEIALDQVRESENITTIVVSTPDQRILDFLSSYGDSNTIFDRRPDELAVYNCRIESTVDYLLKTYAAQIPKPDTITMMNVEYPLRKSIYIDQLIHTLFVFDVDAVVPVLPENSNFYQHLGNGLKPVFDSSRPLRLERDCLYKEVPGLYVSRFTEPQGDELPLIRGKIGHVIVDPETALNFNNYLDLKLIELLSREKLNGK